MPYFNKPFFGQDENPLIKSPFFASWDDNLPFPPPIEQRIISELGDFLISETGVALVTE